MAEINFWGNSKLGSSTLTDKLKLFILALALSSDSFACFSCSFGCFFNFPLLLRLQIINDEKHQIHQNVD